MKVIVGLGNPDSKYELSLHNTGFTAVDVLASALGNYNWTKQFNAQVAKGTWKGESYLLMKPLTYMNLSGKSVQACRQFYKLELPDFIVISDDLDMEPGKVKYKKSGGHGGHNGLRNIIQLCGGNDFHRLRIGIGRPAHSGAVTSYVLGKPPEDIAIAVDNAIERSRDYLMDFLQGNPIQVQNNPSLSKGI